MRNWKWNCGRNSKTQLNKSTELWTWTFLFSISILNLARRFDPLVWKRIWTQSNVANSIFLCFIILLWKNLLKIFLTHFHFLFSCIKKKSDFFSLSLKSKCVFCEEKIPSKMKKKKKNQTNGRRFVLLLCVDRSTGNQTWKT